MHTHVGEAADLVPLEQRDEGVELVGRVPDREDLGNI
jgi:hypothetical protein